MNPNPIVITQGVSCSPTLFFPEASCVLSPPHPSPDWRRKTKVGFGGQTSCRAQVGFGRADATHRSGETPEWQRPHQNADTHTYTHRHTKTHTDTQLHTYKKVERRQNLLRPMQHDILVYFRFLGYHSSFTFYCKENQSQSPDRIRIYDFLLASLLTLKGKTIQLLNVGC